MLLGLAALLSFTGLAWFALGMERHWRQLRGTQPLPRATALGLRTAGAAAVVASLLFCLAADHASMAALVFVMLLALAAAALALTLAFRPRWLAPLIAFAG
jgi:hypothetical protein